MNDDKVEKLEKEVAHLREIINKFVGIESYVFQYHSQILDGRNIQLGLTTGTQIGTATTQKLAFLGATPAVRQSAITAPAGGGTVDAEARAAINTIITTLETFGFVAPN